MLSIGVSETPFWAAATPVPTIKQAQISRRIMTRGFNGRLSSISGVLSGGGALRDTLEARNPVAVHGASPDSSTVRTLRTLAPLWISLLISRGTAIGTIGGMIRGNEFLDTYVISFSHIFQYVTIYIYVSQ